MTRVLPRIMTGGFSLVELLVSIGVIAVILSLLLPALSSAKISASKLKSLSNLNQIGASLQLYVDDSRGMFPFFPRDTPHLIGPPTQPIGILFVDDDPWSMRYLWPTVMHRVAPWDSNYANWIGVGRDSGELPWLSDSGAWLSPSYHMSNSFVASPQTWAPAGPARIQASRMAQVSYPSAKVVCFDFARPYINNPSNPELARGILLVDGSAADSFDRDASQPAPNRLSDREPLIYHDTPNGIHGRDF